MLEYNKNKSVLINGSDDIYLIYVYTFTAFSPKGTLLSPLLFIIKLIKCIKNKMDIKMTIGSIYKIVFPHGKHYVGLTTTSLEQRKKEHKFCAKNGDTKCLYNALRKHDIVDTFELIEIDTAETLEELCEKEIRYIVEYNSYYMDNNGYNMTRGGDGTNGYVFTDEDKQKISEERKKYYEEHPEAREKNREAQKNRSSEWKYKRADTLGQNKPFDVFAKDGNFIKTFTYPFEANEYLQKEYNITSRVAISSVLSGKLGSSLGFVFKYKEMSDV
jgi:hypothetical protein